MRTSQPLRHRHFIFYSNLLKKQMRKMKPKERKKFREAHEGILYILRRGPENCARVKDAIAINPSLKKGLSL